MALLVNMNTPNQNMMTSQEERLAKKIACKSSVNVLPFLPSNHNAAYPIPEELRMAIEFDRNDDRLIGAAKEYSKIIPCLRNFSDLKENNYWFLMKLLLYLDHYQCMKDMSQYTIYRQKIALSKYSKNHLVIFVPGLAEERPSVRSRDLVILKQSDGDNHAVTSVSYVGEQYLTTKVEPGFLMKFHESQDYNIFFLYPDYCLNCMHNAVDRATKFELLPMLFPSGRPNEKLHLNQDVIWLNDNIKTNPEQQQAVIQILAKSAFPAPYILFGPPGTGKTSTVVEAIGQILKKNSSNRILVCTPSNAAADEVAIRLLKYIDGCEMHRMYSLSRDSKDISDSIKPYSNFAGEAPLYISREILVTKKIVITTLITCHRLISYHLRENHFSYVFVDEAGQATEPETLIPMTLMSSGLDCHKGRLHGQLVIAGDPKQLGPSVMSRIAEPLLGRSMLERLMESDLYSKKLSNGYNRSYVTKLVQNYRCHPDILRVPNNLFYDGELKTCGGDHKTRAIFWHKLPKPDFPIIFHAVDGPEARDASSPSVYNAEEVDIVISYVRDLLNSNLGGKPVLESEIGIVTPYRLQRQKIHDQLKKNNWPNVSVGTVETFQGQERDIIIMSTVRSVLYRHFGRVHIGFLSNPKRFNVALTRARALLIVIGNPVVLRVDVNWRIFINYCIDNGACCGCDIPEGPLSRQKIDELMAKKHVPIIETKCIENCQIVEEEPIPLKTFILPEKNPSRRRRLPRLPSSRSETITSDEYCSAESQPCSDVKDLREDTGSDWYSDCLDDQDDYGMMKYFLQSSCPTLVSPPQVNGALKHPENSLESTSMTTTTDQSDKSANTTDEENLLESTSMPTTTDEENLLESTSMPTTTDQSDKSANTTDEENLLESTSMPTTTDGENLLESTSMPTTTDQSDKSANTTDEENLLESTSMPTTTDGENLLESTSMPTTTDQSDKSANTTDEENLLESTGMPTTTDQSDKSANTTDEDSDDNKSTVSELTELMPKLQISTSNGVCESGGKL